MRRTLDAPTRVLGASHLRHGLPPMTCSCAPHLGCRCRTRASASPWATRVACHRKLDVVARSIPRRRSRRTSARSADRCRRTSSVATVALESSRAASPRQGARDVRGGSLNCLAIDDERLGKCGKRYRAQRESHGGPSRSRWLERSAASARDQRDSSRSHTTRYTGSRLPASSRISGSLGSQERAPSRRSSGVPSPADLRARGRPATIAGCTTASMMARLRWRPRRRYPRHVAATGHQPLARRLKKPVLRPARVSVASCNGSRAARAGRSRDRIVEIAGRGVSRRGIQGGSDPSSAAAAPAERTAEARYAPIRARLQGSVRALGVAESSLSDATPSPRPSGPSAWPGWPNWRTRSCLGLCQLPGPIARTS